MTRIQYALYITRRIVESIVIIALAALVISKLQEVGWFPRADHRWALKVWNAVAFWQSEPVLRKPAFFRPLDWWTWPAAFGALAYLILGPKQTRPVYLKIPGAMYCYAGVVVDRNAGSRGGLITGATGSGKTQIVINPRNHSLMVNECGVEKDTWASSPSKRTFERMVKTFHAQTKRAHDDMTSIVQARAKLADKITPLQDKIIDELYSAIVAYQIKNPDRPFTAMVFGDDPDATPECVRLAISKPVELTEQRDKDGNVVLDKAGKPLMAPKAVKNDWTKLWLRSGAKVTPDDAMRLVDWARNANRYRDVSRIPGCGSAKFQKLLHQYARLVEQDTQLDTHYNKLLYLVQVRRNDLQKFADTIKPLRWKVPPCGMLVIGAKGNEHQNIMPMLHHYRRDEDICLLQTRPDNAPDTWTPPAMFNLISYLEIPSQTYAQLLSNTYASISQKDTMDYWDNAARDMVAYGIDLMRAIRAAQDDACIPSDESQRVVPNLCSLCEIFTTLDQYKKFLLDANVAPRTVERTIEEPEKQPDGSVKRVLRKKTIELQPLVTSMAIEAARREIEGGYWGLADETQKSVMGSIRNLLIPFTETDTKEVFCGNNTFDLREISYGKIVCIAMPPKLTVQRQFVCTIMKNLVYQLIKERFSLQRSDPRYKYRNLVMVDSDEHQTSAGKEDSVVDIIREANGTLYAASQTRNALEKTYGGAEKAKPILANLRNTWACQAGTDECAEATSKLIGSAYYRKHTSQSRGGGSSTWQLEPIVSKYVLKALSPFYVYWIPAEGKWLYKFCITMPVTPDCKVPPWWFGDWNLWHWFCKLVFLPATISLLGKKFTLHPGSDFIPPWKGKAPLRAQVRYLLGLDGTFIVLDKLTRKKAQQMARRHE